MQPLLYSELVPWYRLVDPPADHFDEAESYREALERAASPTPEKLLELGAGAGHNASYLKRRFRCTLTDLSEDMLNLSRTLNPECEHIAGDMRTLRLHRSFDAVLVHDAVSYMTSEADLAAAARTAFVHTRPGGAALFAPDELRENFRESTILLEGQEGTRALRGLEWTWDPDPSDDTCLAEFALLLRDGDQVRAVHDRHLVGLFSRDTWLRVLREAGYEVELTPRPVDGEDPYCDEAFLCRRPGAR
jgi:SAM-dependent methyltransferase